MAFDGIVLRSIKNELEKELLSGKIDKIYQPEKDEIVLSIRTSDGAKKLFLSADPNYPRINLTKNSYENPISPPLFCMLLRKHIGGGKIISFKQYGSDRILEIKISSYNELGDAVEKSVIIEIMSRRSNIILIDEKRKIIDCIKRVDFSLSEKRQLLPGLFYEPAPGQGKIDINSFAKNQLESVAADMEEIDCDKFLMSIYDGVSPILSRECGFISSGESGAHILKNENERTEKFISAASEFVSTILNTECPTILFEDKKPKYFSAHDINQYGNLYIKEHYKSVSEMVDLFYDKLHFERKMSIRTHELNSLLNNLCDKLTKKISIHNDTILNSDNLEELRLCGELLTANIHLLKGGEKEITVFNYYDGSEKTIDLDPMLSPSKNIQKYFKSYRRGKTGVEEAHKQLQTAQKELEFLESEKILLGNAATSQEVEEIKQELKNEGYIRSNQSGKKRKPQGKSGFLKFTSSEGYTILAGKNNIQNDELTLKTAAPYDLWFHIKNYPGTHTVLKLDGKKATDKAIYEAAQIAASLSKKGSGKIPIDYTYIKFVKKPAGAKPGMVIYTDYKTIMIDN